MAQALSLPWLLRGRGRQLVFGDLSSSVPFCFARQFCGHLCGAWFVVFAVRLGSGGRFAMRRWSSHFSSLGRKRGSLAATQRRALSRMSAGVTSPSPVTRLKAASALYLVGAVGSAARAGAVLQTLPPRRQARGWRNFPPPPPAPKGWVVLSGSCANCAPLRPHFVHPCRLCTGRGCIRVHR